LARKLTIQVSDEFYDGLQRHVGKRGIGKFLEEVARPYVVRPQPGDRNPTTSQAHPQPRSRLTSNLKRVYAWETRVEVKGQSRKALADQIRTAAKERLSSRAGSHSLADLRG
jgi:mRNA-degrading endonuclease toxin of MazEF toxin-antitoxin module